MPILRRFLKFLEWLENIQAFLYFLTEPTGFALSSAILFYFTIQYLGYDILSAIPISLSLALVSFCLLERSSL